VDQLTVDRFEDSTSTWTRQEDGSWHRAPKQKIAQRPLRDVNERLAAVEDRLDTLEAELDWLDARLDALEGESG
jgi:hypothetical protein